jgi:hypothetical protein
VRACAAAAKVSPAPSGSTTRRRVASGSSRGRPRRWPCGRLTARASRVSWPSTAARTGRRWPHGVPRSSALRPIAASYASSPSAETACSSVNTRT